MDKLLIAGIGHYPQRSWMHISCTEERMCVWLL